VDSLVVSSKNQKQSLTPSTKSDALDEFSQKTRIAIAPLIDHVYRLPVHIDGFAGSVGVEQEGICDMLDVRDP
jgi:hypothetical protein